MPTFRITATGPDATTVTVTAGQPHGWGFFYDSGSGPLAGSYVPGPATPPMGHGSARLVTTVSTQGPALAVVPLLGGTRLDQISELTYSTYRSSADAGNNLAISLQFPIDFNLNDSTSLTRAASSTSRTTRTAVACRRVPGRPGTRSAASGGRLR